MALRDDIDLLSGAESNCHIHTPYSFSAFSDIDEVFSLARKEKISILGINDFYVTDGYEEFHDGSIKSGIFPLFNIEFIGLIKLQQKKGTRINDPNNPGRIYFCGKGLDYPFRIDKKYSSLLSAVREETQKQLITMVDKLNVIIREVDPALGLDFENIRKRFAKELVRERHLAKAIRILAKERYDSEPGQMAFIEALFGGKKSKTGMNDPSALENEIRSNLLKAGGKAFVEEDDKSFLDIDTILNIILNAGGIPCYPVLLDDPSGKYTEFEQDPQKLCEILSELGIGCIELIPGRNDHGKLEEFVEFFHSNNFVITFGTEHNTPEMIPLVITARGGAELNKRMKEINIRGACILAAHQYFRAKGKQGFTDDQGRARTAEADKFEMTGRKVLGYYFKNIAI